jgi:hypothetical protein
MNEIIGWVAFGVAALVTAANVYVGPIRYGACKLVGKECRHISGLPGIGTFCLAAGLALLWYRPIAWLVALLLGALDIFGLPWFCGTMIWMYFFWKEPPKGS